LVNGYVFDNNFVENDASTRLNNVYFSFKQHSKLLNYAL